MAVSTHTLETLYRQGTINHVPYDLAVPFAPVAMNATQYLNTARQGLLYNTALHPDVFVRHSEGKIYAGNNYSIKEHAFESDNPNYNIADKAFGEETKGFRDAVKEKARAVGNGIAKNKILQGILGGGVLATILYFLTRGK